MSLPGKTLIRNCAKVRRICAQGKETEAVASLCRGSAEPNLIHPQTDNSRTVAQKCFRTESLKETV